MQVERRGFRAWVRVRVGADGKTVGSSMAVRQDSGSIPAPGTRAHPAPRAPGPAHHPAPDPPSVCSASLVSALPCSSPAAMAALRAANLGCAEGFHA